MVVRMRHSRLSSSATMIAWPWVRSSASPSAHSDILRSSMLAMSMSAGALSALALSRTLVARMISRAAGVTSMLVMVQAMVTPSIGFAGLRTSRDLC
ncbi:hypothetical protein KTR9_4984 (plasmid) [Gordonia sp. KTR9]|nr:hypothetical protein KTR9_4984 [Gordonia sp. KTR9]